MKIGSLFAGLGGLDLACEWALGASTAWQLDLVGHDVRRRHWPDARQVVADVTTVDPLDLGRVDVLCGGFPCQDLSQAGKRAGLDGERSGLYREVVRFAAALRPDVVVLENVPGVLAYRERIDRDFRGLGYGLTWVRARALDAGAPHLRARVFIVGVAGTVGRGVVEAPRDGAWRGETEVRLWPTPCHRDDHADGRAHTRGGTSLGDEVRLWPTPTGGDAAASGSRSLPGNNAHAGTSLTDAIRADRAADRPWPTPSTRDYKVGSGLDRVGTPPLSEAAVPPAHHPGRRLSPDWVETLMGLPVGWTRPDGPALHVERDPRWPRGRYPEGWDRSQHWPGYEWEPARTLPDGPAERGRPARLRAIGNAVVPRQAWLALRAGGL